MSRLVNEFAAPALLSTVVWCLIWMISFFVLNLWAHSAGVSSPTVALLVTISVISAHLPKIISLLIHTDTDFRKEEQWDFKKLKWFRLVFSVQFCLPCGCLQGDSAGISLEIDCIECWSVS